MDKTGGPRRTSGREGERVTTKKLPLVFLEGVKERAVVWGKVEGGRKEGQRGGNFLKSSRGRVAVFLL